MNKSVDSNIDLVMDHIHNETGRWIGAAVGKTVANWLSSERRIRDSVSNDRHPQKRLLDDVRLSVDPEWLYSAILRRDKTIIGAMIGELAMVARYQEGPIS